MSIADILPQKDSARSTRGRVPLSRVLLNNETMDVTVTHASMVLSEGQHDEAKVSCTSATLTDVADLVDKPISFVWGVAPHSEFFHGYITEVAEESKGATGALTFTMTILGPTKVMFEGFPRFWAKKSVTSAVKEIVSRNLLGFTGHEHTHLWSGLAQTGESDWEMINNFLNRIGWRLWSRYGVVGAFDPLKLFREAGMYTRLVMGSEYDPIVDRNLLEFQPGERSKLLKQNLGLKYGYFTTSGNVQVATQVGEFKGYVFATEIAVENQDVATVYTNAATSSIDRWSQYALARCWGDADLYPGMCVEVVSSNTKYVRTKYDGKWLIRSASHQMDRQSYQTLLFLVRPDSSTPVRVGVYAPFWQDGSGRSRPTLALSSLTSPDEEPPRWQSSWADRRAGGAG